MKKVSFLVIAILSFNLGSLKAQDIEKGKWYILQEQYGTAKGIFNTLLKSAPNNGKAWYYLGQVYFTLNVPDSAEYCYQKGSTLDPLEPFNFLGLAKMQLNKGNKPDWFKLYDRGRKLAKAKLDYFLEAAESGIDGKVKDYDLANKYLDEAKAVNPKSAKYFIIMGDIDLLRKSPGDAANEYERAVFYDKSSIEAYLKLGKLYSAAKNYRDATNAFNSAVAIDSSQILVYEYLGDLNYTFGKYAEARKYYDIYMHRAENTFENEERYAFIMFFNKDYKEAGELIDKMIQRDPKQSVMYRLKAYIDYENGDYTTGLNEIQHFFEIQDSSKFIPLDYVYYGRLLMKNSQDSLGILKLKKAVDLDSTRYDLYDEIAKTYSRLKKHQDAIDSYNELLKRSNGMAPDRKSVV
jgi:predicted Zn-dependent protease